MRAALLALAGLALVLAAGCREARAQGIPGSIECSAIHGGCSSIAGHAPGGQAPAFVDLFAHTFEPAAYTLPCTGAVACEMLCTANASGVWSCVDEAGAALGVTLGTGHTGISSPFGNSAIARVDDTTAPRLTTPADMAGFFDADHTVVFVGATTVTTTAYALASQASSGGLDVRFEGSSTRCIWGTAGTTISTAGVHTRAWQMTACRGDVDGGGSGTHVMDVWSNLQKTTRSTANAPAEPSGGNFLFGRDNGTGSSLRGPLSQFALYSAAKTDAWLTEQFQRWQGTWNDEAPLTTTTDDRWVLIGSDYQRVGKNTLSLSAAGVLIDGITNSVAHTNYFSATPRTTSAWTEIGTSVVTAATHSGPFSAWFAAAQGFTLTDDDGTGDEGVEGNGSAATVLGPYTASAWCKAGTQDRARFVVDTDGTGGGECTVVLTETLTRHECNPTAVTGSPTATRMQILVGDDAADTGTILCEFPQMNRKKWATAPIEAASGIPDVTVPASETTGWDLSSGGEVEVVFTLDHTVPTDDHDNDDSFFVFDSESNAGVDHSVILWYQQSADQLRHATRASASGGDLDLTDTYFNGVDFAEGQQYVWRFRWTRTGSAPLEMTHTAYLDECADADTCEATTLIATESDKYAPDQIEDVWLGRRYTDTFPINGSIKRVAVRLPP